jgi:signal transduction histidine kinase
MKEPTANTTAGPSVAWKLQSALEPRWRHSGDAAVTTSGIARNNLTFGSQAHSLGFTQSAALENGSTPWSETLSCSAVMEERRRMDREIHDTLTQEFAGILLHLEAVKSADVNNWGISHECLARARELAKSGLEDARRMLLNLRPKLLEGATLAVALSQLAERFSRDGGVACKFRTSGQERDLPADIQDELYRVAQEAMCNVRKHSRATFVSLSLRHGLRSIVLSIKDNGQGFMTIKRPADGDGFGLLTMRERAYRLGGKIEIKTAPGTGTEVIITVQLPGVVPMEWNNP